MAKKMIDNLEFKIFSSEEGDWYVAAKKKEGKPIVLYEGHSRSEAYRAILEDIGMDVPIEDRDMEELGTYVPVKKDFSK